MTILHMNGHGTEHTEKVEQFKADNGIRYILAFSGGADDGNNMVTHMASTLKTHISGVTSDQIDSVIKEAKNEYIASLVRDVLSPLRGYKVGILTGGTKWGVPKVAAHTAKDLGFKTIGVFPLTAHNKGHTLGEDVLDFCICVHPPIGESRWGDEAAVFTKLLNGVVIIGGGAGTMVEVTHLLKRNEKTGLPTKHLMPIIGTGGTADKVMSFPGKPDIMRLCLPPHPLTSGAEVCDYLKCKVFFDDLFD